MFYFFHQVIARCGGGSAGASSCSDGTAPNRDHKCKNCHQPITYECSKCHLHLSRKIARVSTYFE